MTFSRNPTNKSLEARYKLIAAVYLSGLTTLDEMCELLTHFDYEFIEKLQRACEISLYEKDERNPS